MGSPITATVTASEIATLIDQSVIRVRHVLATRNIQPLRVAGLVRLFAPDTVQLVRKELQAIDKWNARRKKTHA